MCDFMSKKISQNKENKSEESDKEDDSIVIDFNGFRGIEEVHGSQKGYKLELEHGKLMHCIDFYIKDVIYSDQKESGIKEEETEEESNKEDDKFRVCELNKEDLREWIIARKKLGRDEYGDEHLNRYNLVDVAEELIDALIIVELFEDRILKEDEDIGLAGVEKKGVLKNKINEALAILTDLDTFIGDDLRREDVERVYFNSLSRGDEGDDGDESGVSWSYSVSSSDFNFYDFDSSGNYYEWPANEDFQERSERIEGYGYVDDNFSVGDRVFAKKDIERFPGFFEAMMFVDKGCQGKIISEIDEISNDGPGYEYMVRFDGRSILIPVTSDEITTDKVLF